VINPNKILVSGKTVQGQAKFQLWSGPYLKMSMVGLVCLEKVLYFFLGETDRNQMIKKSLHMFACFVKVLEILCVRVLGL
jgi:hypothetical protein